MNALVVVLILISVGLCYAFFRFVFKVLRFLTGWP